MMNYIFFLLGFLQIFSAFAQETKSAPGKAWQQLAIELSADLETRNAAIDQLKKIKNLEKQLSESYGDHKNLVLSVVSALNMVEFCPKIYDRIKKSKGSELDRMLLTTATQTCGRHSTKDLVVLLESKLSDAKISDTAVVAIVSGLQNVQHSLTVAQLRSLLNHKSYEVRMAAVVMAKEFRVRDISYEDILVKALTIKPYQVRELVLNDFSRDEQLRKKYQNKIDDFCKSEKHEELKEICLKIMSKKE